MLKWPITDEIPQSFPFLLGVITFLRNEHQTSIIVKDTRQYPPLFDNLKLHFCRTLSCSFHFESVDAIRL